MCPLKDSNINDIQKNDIIIKSKIFENERQVFAFQMFKKKDENKKITPQNDKPIYDSIITSIKAYEHEKNSLIKRKDSECFYNFNLISVCDTELIEAHFKSESEIDVKEVDDIKYINRHIIFGNEEFYRVHFIQSKKFEKILEEYNKLCVKNSNTYSTLKQNFYRSLLKGNSEGNSAFTLLEDEFLAEINKKLYLIIRKMIKYVSFEYSKNDNILKIDLRLEDFLPANNLFCNSYAEEMIKETLLKVYKYDRAFKFDEVLPF